MRYILKHNAIAEIRIDLLIDNDANRAPRILYMTASFLEI